MGKLNETTGALSGLVGTVVASSWRGIRYLKHKGRKSKKPRSIKQLQHQAKIGLVSKFVYSMKGLLDQSFISFAIKKTGTNAAFSYNLKNCITGEYPSYAINYGLVLVSRGDIPNAINPAVTMNGNGEVRFTWSDNSGTGMAKAGDKGIGVIHCPEFNITVYTKGTDTRQSGLAVLSLNGMPQLKGKTLETWLAFISANGMEGADSVYTGQVVVG